MPLLFIWVFVAASLLSLLTALIVAVDPAVSRLAPHFGWLAMVSAASAVVTGMYTTMRKQ